MAPSGITRPGISRHVETLAAGWALVGGALLCLVVLANVLSILGAALLNQPVPGDFEMSEVGVAVAAFCFLPYCQICRANVSADIFTAGASPRWIARFSLLGSLAALLFAGLLIWRMSLGMIDQKTYGYTTTILQFPHWLAFLPILLSLALLALTAAVTLVEDARGAVAPNRLESDRSKNGRSKSGRSKSGRSKSGRSGSGR